MSIATLLLCVLPLIWHGVALWRSGGYVTQRYMWRSAPAGIDVTTLVASLVLLIMSFLACYLPARRATRLDPVAALRPQ